MSAVLQRREDRWKLPCEGLVVGQVRIDYEALAPALIVRHQQLITGDLWADGHIRMAFANGSVLEVEPHERYEAWTLTSDLINGVPRLLVCTPGGEEVDWSR